MNHRSLSRLIAVAALATPYALALAQAQAPAPDARLPLVYEAASREAPAVVHRNTCPIHVLAVEDLRQNKLTIGANIGGPLLTGDASPWITDTLLHLKDFGYAVQRAEGGAPPADGILVKSAVTRAYTWQIGLKIFSMVALKAQFIDRNGVLQDKYYRAHGDKTNMWGASSEYITTLNYGVNNLLRVMAEDLTQLCKGTHVEPYSYAGPDPKPPAR
jgi:hypothetical protein